MSTRNIEALLNPLYIGNGSNRVKFDTDGTIRLEGDSTAFDDMVGNLLGYRLNSSAGKVDYDWDENAITFQPGGVMTTAADRVQWNKEIKHKFKVGTGITFYPHMHWWQPDGTTYDFDLRYRLQRNGYAKATSWTTITLTTGGANDVFTYTSGTLNQITTWAPFSVDCGMSDTFQFQLVRTDLEIGNISATMIDIHGEVDALGSETEYTKD